ncbi:DUF3429 domain-containing protein [Aurantimonas sp. C2-6-R+9]|uniref:DUF3429 domain-containing protein n=1 Tax=unclassified Aurantimonas TaxID=2638230 RepID=UPI002E17D0C7|nr:MULTISPECIES: DUF3429 domain-containing protein [unclassified Aurantimonas]MEC5291237.1 DUF3429 domain-containing protein [Aurantimonas sp. C2-3-R2]MEC5380945.1 DUF3429 domain-containing protein [Aurantimonas sp. C2-6-R+9]MEC5412273.1 DUF3429 domain-containing protein [Aurantimonas sp. C2-4-R8]
MTNTDLETPDRSARQVAETLSASTASVYASHKTAWTLGVLGLVPFVLMAVIFAYAGRSFIAYPMLVLAFSGYSATILAFLGGIRWGIGMVSHAHRRRVLILSVLPSLAGWILLFVPSPWVFAGFAAAFALQGAWDMLAARRRELPAWFGRLRLVLTGVVVLCQLVAFASTY